MMLSDLYYEILKNKNAWNYYNKDLVVPDFDNPLECCHFVKEFIKSSGKSESNLYSRIDNLFNNDPNRFNHIVSTFFLGLVLFENKKFNIKDDILRSIKRFNGFKNSSNDEINKELIYIWFMITLFHDLGYEAEDQNSGIILPECKYRLEGNCLVPDVYTRVYREYYKYRENKEHGIYAGILFFNDICEIRKVQAENPNTNLRWDRSLVELYRNVAWIIISHNIWFARQDDVNVDVYRSKGLDSLILSIETVDNRYKCYPISFGKYPLFFIFCLVDAIDPLKLKTDRSTIFIEFSDKSVSIKCDKSEYIEEILKLNSWLIPTNVFSGGVSFCITIGI